MPDGTARVGGARFDNLTSLTLTEAERYTYTFDGRSQAIDHILVNDLLSGVAGYDVVHINTGFNPHEQPGTVGSRSGPGAASTIRNFAELLDGTAGGDMIHGFGGNDTIIGGAGDDVLIGGTGIDHADGGDGNDVIYGEGGIDIARGGAGDDVYIVDASTDIVEEAYGGGNDTVLTQVSYLLTSGAEVELLSTTFHAGTAQYRADRQFRQPDDHRQCRQQRDHRRRRRGRAGRACRGRRLYRPRRAGGGPGGCRPGQRHRVHQRLLCACGGPVDRDAVDQLPRRHHGAEPDRQQSGADDLRQ